MIFLVFCGIKCNKRSKTIHVRWQIADVRIWVLSYNMVFISLTDSWEINKK